MSGSSSTIRMLKLMQSLLGRKPPSRGLHGGRSNDLAFNHGFRRSVLDLQNPNIRISCPLAGDVGIGIGLDDWNRAGCPHPKEFAILPARLRQHRTAGGTAVELEQARTRISVAPSSHGDRDSG